MALSQHRPDDSEKDQGDTLADIKRLCAEGVQEQIIAGHEEQRIIEELTAEQVGLKA